MKYILIVFVFCLYSCGALDHIRRSCMTDISKTPNGNFIFCAVCDSLTFDKFVKNDTTIKHR